MKKNHLTRKSILYLVALLSLFSCTRDYDYEEPEYENVNALTTVATTNQGKIIVCGSFFREKKPKRGIAVMQFDANGNIDKTFADNGSLIIEVQAKYFAYSNVLKILDNGEILLLSSSHLNGERLFHTFLFKLTSDGNFDPSFGTNGKITIEGYSYTTMKIRTNGSIVLAGTYIKYGDNKKRKEILTQLTPDGQIDNSFNNGEQLRINYKFYNTECMGIDLQSDNKVVLTGNILGQNANYNIVRILEDGSFDTEFSEDGVCITDINESKDEVEGIISLENYASLVTGRYQEENHSACVFLAKYNNDGNLDTTYGTKGFTIINPSYQEMAHKTLYKQSNGGCILFGNTEYELQTYSRIFIYKINQDGNPDENFGFEGLRTIQDDSIPFYCMSASIQADSKMLVVGECLVKDSYYEYGYSHYRDTDFLIFRLNSNGDIDETFGNNGFTKINF